jgi:hypothetical protein
MRCTGSEDHQALVDALRVPYQSGGWLYSFLVSGLVQSSLHIENQEVDYTSYGAVRLTLIGFRDKAFGS